MPNDIAAVADALPESRTGEKLSPWWRRACLFTMALGFSVLILLTVKVYYEAPPIPDKVTDPDRSILYTGKDIRDGQQVFLQHGLMDNGTIWGHGALLGPDFSAEYPRGSSCLLSPSDQGVQTPRPNCDRRSRQSRWMGLLESGFGSFGIKCRTARTGRNPENGRKVHVPEQFVPHFKAGREPRERIDS